VTSRESEWLEAVKRGDDEAFSHLVDAYQKPVYNLCYRMLGNVNSAEDAAQETFLRAYKSISRYDTSRSFVTWLLSIASHYCIDQLRKKHIQSFSTDDEEYAWMAPVDPNPLPETVITMKEKQAQVQSLLSVLNPKDRAAVILRYWYGYSYVEIGNALSLTVSAVKSRLHRAKRELAKTWEYQKTGMLANGRVRNES